MYFKVIKSGTNRKLVHDFPLVVYSNFAVSHSVFEKFDVKESNDLEICPRSLTVVSPESRRVAMYVKCSEDSDRLNRKLPFSTTPLSFDAHSPGGNLLWPQDYRLPLVCDATREQRCHWPIIYECLRYDSQMCVAR